MSRAAGPRLQAPLLLNPWRLTLLFFVSGAAPTPCAARRRARRAQLALPLLLRGRAFAIVCGVVAQGRLPRRFPDVLCRALPDLRQPGAARPRVSICRPTTTCGSCCMCWPTRWWRPPCWQPPVLEPALVTSLTLAGCWAAYALALQRSAAAVVGAATLPRGAGPSRDGVVRWFARCSTCCFRRRQLTNSLTRICHPRTRMRARQGGRVPRLPCPP